MPIRFLIGDSEFDHVKLDGLTTLIKSSFYKVVS